MHNINLQFHEHLEWMNSINLKFIVESTFVQNHGHHWSATRKVQPRCIDNLFKSSRCEWSLSCQQSDLCGTVPKKWVFPLRSGKIAGHVGFFAYFWLSWKLQCDWMSGKKIKFVIRARRIVLSRGLFFIFWLRFFWAVWLDEWQNIYDLEGYDQQRLQIRHHNYLY